MATRTVYLLGGFDPAKPAGNRLEEWDSVAGYTRWSDAGAVLERRALTAEEAAPLAAQEADNVRTTNGDSLRAQASGALAANRSYIALASPTATDTTKQVKALSRQMNALIRLLLGQLDGTD